MQKRYFGTLDRQTLLQISSKGGKMASKLGVAHKFTKEEARIAGLKGLQIRWKKNENTGRQS